MSIFTVSVLSRVEISHTIPSVSTFHLILTWVYKKRSACFKCDSTSEYREICDESVVPRPSRFFQYYCRLPASEVCTSGGAYSRKTFSSWPTWSSDYWELFGCAEVHAVEIVSKFRCSVQYVDYSAALNYYEILTFELFSQRSLYISISRADRSLS